MSGRSKFKDAIREAVRYEDFNVAHPSHIDDDVKNTAVHKAKGRRPANEREALAEAEADFAAAAARISDKHGCAVIWTKPRVSRKRTTPEYVFWKQPVMAFIEFPETLDDGPTALAERYGPLEPNFAVSADTFRAPLSRPARMEAGALLKSRGYDLKLPARFSIRDIQIAMKYHRDKTNGVTKFKAVIEIVGDIIYCNGKSYKMQPTASGKKRIRAGNGWIPVESLTAFLSAQS